eukprot:19739-Heterococcus_DN1.PRE.1
MSQFEDSAASDGAVGLHSISNETYLHILRFLSVESLAKAAQTSRLGAVLSMVAQNVPTLQSFVGAADLILPACKHSMSSKPTIGFLFTAVDSSEFKDELVAALPSTAQLIGASTYEAQAAVPRAATAELTATSGTTAQATDSGDELRDQQQQHEVVVADEGDIALLLGSFPEATATTFMLSKQQLQTLSRSTTADALEPALMAAVVDACGSIPTAADYDNSNNSSSSPSRVSARIANQKASSSAKAATSASINTSSSE